MNRSAPMRRTGSCARGMGRGVLWSACLLLLGGTLVGAGCSSTPEKKKVSAPAARYPTLPPKQNVPAFMKGTVFELADVDNKVPYLVSGYGLAMGLPGTGNNSGTPLSVRNYMVDEMVRHGFGSKSSEFEKLTPERVLQDPRSAMVEVYAYLPPGARAGQRMDIFVQAVTGSLTKSLARGVLYQTDLKVEGVDPLHPKGRVNVFAKAKGPIFVDPTYAKDGSTTRPAVRGNLRSGVVMNGGMVMLDRPLWLRLRAPQISVARTMEMRVDQRFQDEQASKTEDEGLVYVFVPKSFNGDWEHFMGVVTHLYLNGAPGFGTVKAKELAQEALKPDALLQDISYCWEGIGQDALPFIQPLYGHAGPEVAFAAARAGACIRDAAAEQALMEMARVEGHPFQLNAVKTLGALGESTRITRMLTELLGSKNALVRVEAYRILAEQESPAIISRPVRDLFVIDRVPCEGAPMIYASRSGVPRIALFGQTLSLKLPIMFSAMDHQFTISTPPDGRAIVLFDRTDPSKQAGIERRMRPDVYEMIWRLAGGTDDGFAFGYSDLVGILQALSDRQHIAANFVLQDLPHMQDEIEDAPPIAEPGEEPVTAGVIK